MKYTKGILLPALLGLASLGAAKKDEPLVAEQAFESELVNIFYFDDSDVALAAELDSLDVWRSADAGKTWKKQEDMKTLGIEKSPFDNNVAVVLGDKTHWITYDQGEKWTKFETEYPPSLGQPLSFHASDNKKILYHTIEDCFLAPCLGQSLYTTDGFKSKPKAFINDRKMCMWAKSSELLLKDTDKMDDRIMCITRGKYSLRQKDFRLLISDNYFDTEDEPVMSSGRTVQGMTNMASVKGHFVVAAKSDHSNELALYVTDDTKTWHHAEFDGGKLEEDAYTILESTNYSIQVDVVTSKYAVTGSLYTSNSNGTYFTKNIENTNRNDRGYVDFEKISNIQGIVIVNTVQNAEEAVRPTVDKKLKSQISFDDGRTFEPLKVKGKDDNLHLHSVTNLHNSGRVFSSPAPGIVMGVGNTGDYLRKYTDGDLWVSDDAGLTWELALSEAQKYEFGDQGAVLVAVYDEGDTDTIMYSLKHGRKDTWKEIKLGYKIRARELTTVPDSTSLKFMLYAVKSERGDKKHMIIHLDFSEMHERKCEDKDFEEWAARRDENGDAMCVMGHKQIFRRRKWDADCFVSEEFKDPLPKFEPCDCDEVRDYECDYNFVPNGKQGKDKKCEPSPSLKLPDGACQGDAKTYKGPSGWRKIPGNQCKGSTDREKETEHSCDDKPNTPPNNNEITHEITKFKGSNFKEYYYLEGSSQDVDNAKKDETVVMLTSENEAYHSHDHGKKWQKSTSDNIVAIYPHQYNNDYVYWLTATQKVFYSTNRALDTIHDFEAPQMPNVQGAQIMQFHPKQSDWLIWVGGEKCEKTTGGECHTVASVSQNGGLKGSWEPLLAYVKKCAFVWREAGRHVEEKEVFCEQHINEAMNAGVELLSSEDFFKTKDIKFKSVVEFATMSEFIIVATKGDDGKSLNLQASLDAKTFAEAKFPPKFEVDHQTAYTVLDSSTHSVFLHVTVNGVRDREYGSIIKSNSNGTSYVMSLTHVNRNTAGYVDFEKMQGIEGVALANIVTNVEDVEKSGAGKNKQTRITHNDGADWEPLQAPKVDSEGKSYGCDVSNKEKCGLHLHGYTERADARETFSSPTAVGIFMGVGNVGDKLTTMGEASTFITTDGGLSWKEAKKGSYAWEFGDQGSVIVLVRRGKDTDHLFYTLDMGETWNQYKFSNHAIRVNALTTVPSDTSLKFLIWGKDGSELVAINVDFSGLDQFKKKCDLNENDPTAGDYDLWTPQHPMKQEEPDCLFGHVAQYHRKRATAQCYNGQRIDLLHSIARNCSCTRLDFECDYNYERLPGGECRKIPGLPDPEGSAVCAKGATEYWDITGYRKIPISTCSGGREMEQTSAVHPCPGFEDEFERKHGVSGFVIFLAVVLPFAAAAGIGYYAWRHWDGKFGRIRLGESGGYTRTGGAFDSDAPWIKYPVAAIAGVVAVVAAIPLLVGSLWRMVSGGRGGGGAGGGVGGLFGGGGGRRYTSRSSFARGRGDYAVVDPDEGELLGEDSEDEV
ncbi:vacuolar protein sorting/targeting protein 10 [Periconia macrospinosa]|uniref:Vacuolar protein sorting/targeting protein 10 n=1 Tax=Periconia macrospinosa TaxID=97972 RepID=A0A2V1EC86_9PLEO|nr:vacuolar protein sorting/targeting protein 10 [Periconia macrospinosa]